MKMYLSHGMSNIREMGADQTESKEMDSSLKSGQK